MTNTREEVAVAEAILEASDGYMSNPNIAKAAIAASNSKYLAGLVEALWRIVDNVPETLKEAQDICEQALNNLPEELRG